MINGIKLAPSIFSAETASAIFGWSRQRGLKTIWSCGSIARAISATTACGPPMKAERRPTIFPSISSIVR